MQMKSEIIIDMYGGCIMDRERIKVIMVLIFAFIITGLGNHFIDGM